MSLFGSEFIRNYQEHLECKNGEKVDLTFNHDGYLFLASKDSAPILYENHKKQLLVLDLFKFILKSHYNKIRLNIKVHRMLQLPYSIKRI